MAAVTICSYFGAQKNKVWREDGIGSETDTRAQPVTHLRGRPHGRSSFPKGGGVSLGPSLAGRGTLGLAVTRGDPKTSSKPRSQRSPSAWLPKIGRASC